jgi:enolase
MIAFRKDHDSNNEKSKDLVEKLQQILDIVYEKEKNYPGSLHEQVNISDLIDIVHDTLYIKNKNSIQLIVNKNKNNSLDITIDTIN